MSTKDMKQLVKNMNLFELSSLADVVQEQIASLRKHERLEAIHAVKQLAAKFDIELEATLSNNKPHAPAETPPSSYSQESSAPANHRPQRAGKSPKPQTKSIPKELLDLFNDEE
ncbi:MAG: hypothetical protein ACN6N0_17310 [Microvirgula sp.]